MLWNQSKNERSQWEGDDKGPPDIDEFLKKITGQFGRFFSSGGKGNGSEKKFKYTGGSVIFILIIVVVVWLLSSIYIITEGYRGVVLRFGSYETTTAAGPHWHFPYPIETVEKVDIDSIRSVQNKAQMLTQDENIVDVELAVQYRVKDAPDYLFNVRTPDAQSFENPSEGTIFQVMESALREIIGKSKMDFILGAGRAEIANGTKELMQDILDHYEAGLEIISVNLQQSQPPSAVQDAFADAIKAREDEIRFVNEAEAYSNGIIPKARGAAARMLEEAVAYREQVIANSEGEAARFLKLQGEYSKAPEVTRERLYLQAMETVLSNSSKVMMDIGSSNSLFYLPLDKILENGRSMSAKSQDAGGTNRSNTSDSVRSGIRELRRERGR